MGVDTNFLLHKDIDNAFERFGISVCIPYRSTALGDDIPLANEIQHTVNSVCCIDNRKDWLCESKGQTTDDRRVMRKG